MQFDHSINYVIFSFVDQCLTFRSSIYVESKALMYLANLCDGDARSALNTLQMVTESQLAVPQQNGNGNTRHQHMNGPGVDSRPGLKRVIAASHIKDALQRTHVMYDRGGKFDVEKKSLILICAESAAVCAHSDGNFSQVLCTRNSNCV